MTFGAVDSLRNELNLKAKATRSPRPLWEGLGKGALPLDSTASAVLSALSQPSLRGGGVNRRAQTCAQITEQVEIAAKYAGYIERQQDEIDRQVANEKSAFARRHRLHPGAWLVERGADQAHRQRPETLGQASRISGITPAAISLLLVHLKRGGWRSLWRDRRTRNALLQRRGGARNGRRVGRTRQPSAQTTPPSLRHFPYAVGEAFVQIAA